jgi:hypothetical protein
MLKPLVRYNGVGEPEQYLPPFSADLESKNSMRWASNNDNLYDAVNTAFLIRSANVTEHLVSCFNGDSRFQS